METTHVFFIYCSTSAQNTNDWYMGQYGFILNVSVKETRLKVTYYVITFFEKICKYKTIAQLPDEWLWRGQVWVDELTAKGILGCDGNIAVFYWTPTGCNTGVQFYCFACVYPVIPTPIVEETVLSPLGILCSPMEY